MRLRHSTCLYALAVTAGLFMLAQASLAADERAPSPGCALALTEPGWPAVVQKKQSAIAKLFKARDMVQDLGFVFDGAFTHVGLIKKPSSRYDFREVVDFRKLSANEVGTLKAGEPVAFLTRENRQVFGHVSSVSPFKVSVMQFKKTAESWDVHSQEWLKSPKANQMKKSYEVTLDFGQIAEIRAAEYRYVIDLEYFFELIRHSESRVMTYSPESLPGVFLEDGVFNDGAFRSSVSNVAVRGSEKLEVGQSCTFKIRGKDSYGNDIFLAGILLSMNPPTLAMLKRAKTYREKGEVVIVKIDPTKIELAATYVRPNAVLMTLEPGDKIYLEKQYRPHNETLYHYEVLTLGKDSFYGVYPENYNANRNMFEQYGLKFRKHNPITDDAALVRKTTSELYAHYKEKESRGSNREARFERISEESDAQWQVVTSEAQDLSGVKMLLTATREPITAKVAKRLDFSRGLDTIHATQQQMIAFALDLEAAVDRESASRRDEGFRFKYEINAQSRDPETYELKISATALPWVETLVKNKLDESRLF